MKKTGQKLEITLCGKVVADFRDEKDLLDMAAARVTEWDSQAKHHARQAVNMALAAGAVLLAVRDRLPHGAFLAWVATNCGNISERTARRYMDLAERAAAEFEASGGGGAPKALIGDRSLTDLYRDYGIVRKEASEKWGGAREGAGRKPKDAATVEAELDEIANAEGLLWAEARDALGTLARLDHDKDFLRRLDDEHLAQASGTLADLSRKAGETLESRLARKEGGAE